jgi:ribosomal protein S18 acetylase RimI-like enzyme
MPTVQYREANPSDIPAMARLRIEGEEGGAPEERMARYLAREHHPQQALAPRVIYAALEGDSLVGYIAGHLTRRYACDGELQWIYVVPKRRGSSVATELLYLLAAWSVEQNATRICVNVDPANTRATCFYTRHGAETLNQYWLVWPDINVVLGERRS